jgi:DNA-directed RNA polymerase specialized sigma subunit
MEASGESEVASSPVTAADSPEVLARIQSCLQFVDSIAHQFARVLRHHVEFDDLVGYGRAGLLSAARKYDPSRGVAFEGYVLKAAYQS